MSLPTPLFCIILEYLIKGGSQTPVGMSPPDVLNLLFLIMSLGANDLGYIRIQDHLGRLNDKSLLKIYTLYFTRLIKSCEVNVKLVAMTAPKQGLRLVSYEDCTSGSYPDDSDTLCGNIHSLCGGCPLRTIDKSEQYVRVRSIFPFCAIGIIPSSYGAKTGRGVLIDNDKFVKCYLNPVTYSTSKTNIKFTSDGKEQPISYPSTAAPKKTVSIHMKELWKVTLSPVELESVICLGYPKHSREILERLQERLETPPQKVTREMIIKMSLREFIYSDQDGE